MPLTTCPDCRASVSKSAPACPRCGRPQPFPPPPAHPHLRTIIIAGVVLVLAAFLWMQPLGEWLQEQAAEAGRQAEIRDDARVRQKLQSEHDARFRLVTPAEIVPGRQLYMATRPVARVEALDTRTIEGKIGPAALVRRDTGGTEWLPIEIITQFYDVPR